MDIVKIIITALIFSFVPQKAISQVNIKVGYMLGFTNPTEHNSILEQYNNDNASWLDKEFKNLKSLHGLALGLRYKLDAVAFELTFHNKYSKVTSDGISPITNASFSRKLYYRVSSISLGYEAYFGPFGIGATIDANNFRVNTKHSDIDKRTNLISNYGLSSHFNFSFNFEASDNMSFSLKPYVHIPWHTNNLFPIDESINGVTTDSGVLQDKVINFGVMLVFYNGSYY